MIKLQLSESYQIDYEIECAL